MAVTRRQTGRDLNMTNYEKRIRALTVDKLIELENAVHECSTCYCREYCLKNTNEHISCNEIRKKWLISNEK